MNQGIISVRYARALIKSVANDNAAKDAVYANMQSIANSFIQVPALRKALDNPMLSKGEKRQLLTTAAGAICPQTTAFIDLVLKEGRENIIQFMANSYVTLYRQEKNIISSRLITATAVNAETERKMKSLVEKKSQKTVEFQTEVKPDIIGGFILEFDTYRLDASVKTQLRTILNELK